MKKGKLFAPFLMLLAGAVTSIMMYRFKYSVKQTIIILVTVLIIFYAAGIFIQKKVISFVEQIREREEKEGEVIEKEGPGTGGEEMVSAGTENEADDKA